MNQASTFRASRLLLVDDEPAILASTRMLLEFDEQLEIVGTASDSISAVYQARFLKPDLILMDLKLPDKSGIQATQEIRAFNQAVKILVYTGYPGAAEHALVAGVHGVVLKGRPAKQLADAIKSVLHGGIYFDEGTWAFLKWQLWPKPSKYSFILSDEERTLAPFLIQGLTSKEIADRLKIKARRIEKVRANMMKKLAVRNAAALAARLVYLVPELFPRE